MILTISSFSGREIVFIHTPGFFSSNTPEYVRIILDMF